MAKIHQYKNLFEQLKQILDLAYSIIPAGEDQAAIDSIEDAIKSVHKRITEFETTEVYRCPYCNSERTHVPDGVMQFFVFCPDCFAGGPYGESMEDAIKKWNMVAGRR